MNACTKASARGDCQPRRQQRQQDAPEPLARPRAQHRRRLFQRGIDAGDVGQRQQEGERKAADHQRQHHAPVIVHQPHRLPRQAEFQQRAVEPATRAEIVQQPFRHQHGAKRDRDHQDGRQQPLAPHQPHAQRHRHRQHDVQQGDGHGDPQRDADRVVEERIGEELAIIRQRSRRCFGWNDSTRP